MKKLLILFILLTAIILPQEGWWNYIGGSGNDSSAITPPVEGEGDTTDNALPDFQFVLFQDLLSEFYIASADTLEQQKIIDGMKYANLNTIAWLTQCDSSGLGAVETNQLGDTTIWDAVEPMLELLEAQDMGMWIYISSTTTGDGDGSTPYYLNVIDWAEAVATLMNEHDNLYGLAIDDYPNGFTKAHMDSAMAAGLAIDDSFRVYTVVYYTMFPEGNFSQYVYPEQTGLLMDMPLDSLLQEHYFKLQNGESDGISVQMHYQFDYNNEATTGDSVFYSKKFYVRDNPDTTITFVHRDDATYDTLAVDLYMQWRVDGNVIWEYDCNGNDDMGNKTIDISSYCEGKDSVYLRFGLYAKSSEFVYSCRAQSEIMDTNGVAAKDTAWGLSKYSVELTTSGVLFDTMGTVTDSKIAFLIAFIWEGVDFNSFGYDFHVDTTYKNMGYIWNRIAQQVNNQSDYIGIQWYGLQTDSTQRFPAYMAFSTTKDSLMDMARDLMAAYPNPLPLSRFMPATSAVAITGNVGKANLTLTCADDTLFLYRGTSTDPTICIDTLVAPLTSYAYVDSPLVAGTYHYRARGKNFAGTGAYNTSDTAIVSAGIEYLYESDFSADADGWGSIENLSFTGNQDGVNDGSTSKDDCLKIAGLGSDNGTYWGGTGANTTWVSGSTCNIQFDYYLPSSNTRITGFDILNNYGDAEWTGSVTTGTWTHFNQDIEVDADRSIAMFIRFSDGDTFINPATTDPIYIKDVKTYIVE